MKTICITIGFEKQSSCSITMTQLEEIGDVSWVGGLKFDYGGDIGQEVWMVECFIDNNEIGFNLDREYNFKDEYEYFLQYFRRKKIATKEELRLAPLWCSSFVRVLSNRILKFAEVRGGVKHCSINSIVEERNIGTAGYLGVKFGCIFGTKVFKREAYESDAYALDRLHFGPYAAEIDPLNISIGKDLKHFNSDLVKNHNKFSIKRIAITLLDAGSQFVFANANSTGFITNCAEQMEKSLTAQRAESFTSFLVKERISSPISLNYSPQEESSFFIRYLDESIGVHNALDESLQISSNNTLPSLASASKGLRLGLAENFRFIKKAIEEGEDETANARLYFYPINHGASLYFFPAFILFLIVGSQMADSDRKIESNFLPIVRADFSEALTIEAITLLRRAKQFACKSAIGSIMSRNGSHNIGSHVLAALSHNVGTMPDDRVLYQYIQHRMDYIATATTEFPIWRQPTMLVSDMMRTFLSQTHLLNYISRSEGLRAYQFQNPSIDKDADQYQTIKFHIRKIHDDCNNWECVSLEGEKDKVDSFIEYGGNDSASFDKDVAVAIPGGVVGQHAFFTILENVIRNAAKHEWSKAKSGESNLDVYVDFRDNRKAGTIEMRIWNDCNGPKDNNKADKSNRHIDKTISELKEKINRSFISPDSGELVRENWGLAEMRISAGFLKDSGIEKIGGIGEEEGKSCELVWPIAITHGNKECLGYRFDLLKPKELLVIIPDRVDKRDSHSESADAIVDDLDSINGALAQFGIELIRKCKIDELSKGLPYSYVLINDLDFVRDERLLTRLPFRVLSRNAVKNPRNKDVIAPYVGDFYSVEGDEDFDDKIQRLKASLQSTDKARKFAHDLLEDVYASWLNHIRRGRGVSVDAKLVIDVDGCGEGAAKSLVTDSDLLHFVFEHSFNSAVRGYLKTVGKNQIHPELVGALYLFLMLDTKKIMSVNDLSKCLNAKGNPEDVAKKIALQLIRFAEMSVFQYSGKTIDVGKTDQDGTDYVADEWKKSLVNMNANDCIAYIYKGCQEICSGDVEDGTARFLDVKAFVRYLRDVVLEQAKSFLAKYEERIVTIPKAFVSATPNSCKGGSKGTAGSKGEENDRRDAPADVPVVNWYRRDNSKNSAELVLSAVFSSNRSIILEKDYHKGGLCYWRHGDDGRMKGGSLDEVEYFEPLSGSQSYLNSLISLRNNIDLRDGVDDNMRLPQYASDKRLSSVRDMTGLVESALMRVLIIDERACKFAMEHSVVARIFEKTGIRVLDETSIEVCRLSAQKPSFDLVKDFEIVIIHQGILDKILKKDHSKSGVEKFLQMLKPHIRYVVVTTGRGVPSNIPETARVLPFSVVESTLFTRYPEKMLLVDTIMNILPVERK